MLQQIFIYCPKSGSRIIVDASRHPILTVDLEIGTIVAGDCVKISWESSEPGRWWRDTATRLAEQICRAVGGVAFDAQGTIGMVVPASSAHEVRRWMTRLGKLTAEDLAVMDAQLWKQGLATLGNDEYGAMTLAPQPHVSLPRGQEITTGLARVVCPVDGSEPTPVLGFALRVGAQTVGDEQWVGATIDIHCRGSIEGYPIRAIGWGDICAPSWVAGEESARIITHPSEFKLVDGTDVVSPAYGPTP